MRNQNFILIFLILISAFVLVMCGGDDEEFKICVDRCPPETPWKVESLDYGNPCFATKEACLEWAADHGYGDKPCIRCD